MPSSRKRKQSEVGSHARNAYQGHRSEIIAEFFFSGFGTVVPVPRPADTGVDLYCTLTEPAGKKAFSTHLYSVQVKSEPKPFVIDSARSMEWLIRHPLPLFLCVVQKKRQRILVFNMPFRFSMWALPPLPESLTVVPGSSSGGEKVKNRSYLSDPFIEAKFSDLSDETKMAKFRKALIRSIGVEDDNLLRVRMGVREFVRLNQGLLNGQVHWGVSTFWKTTPSDEHVKEASQKINVPLSWIAKHLVHTDPLGALLATILHRRICYPPLSFRLAEESRKLNETYGFQDSKQLGGFCDALLERLERLLPPEAMKKFMEGGASLQ